MGLFSYTFILQFAFFSFLNIGLSTKIASKIFQSKNIFKISFIILLLIQIISIGLLKDEVGDVKQFSTAGWTLKNGMDIYKIDISHNIFPFLPFLIYFHVLFNVLVEQLPLFTFSFYLKLFLLIPSIYLVGYLIYLENKKESLIEARLLFLQLLTSPITYAIVLFHGQTDVILLMLFLWGAKLLITGKDKKSYIVGLFAYGLSIATKTWSGVLIPLLVKYQKTASKKLGIIFGSGLTILGIILIYSNFVFRPKLDVILLAVLKAGGPIGMWGLSYLGSFNPSILTWFINNNIIIFGLLFLCFQVLILKKNISFLQSCLLTILSMYIVIANWGIQYLFWVIPFIYMLKSKLNHIHINIFLIISSFYLFISYLNISAGEIRIIPNTWINSIGFLLWIFIIYWFIYLIKNLKKVSGVTSL